MDILEAFFYLQTLNTTLAVLFNVFLVYIVTLYTRNKIGMYKWIIVSYAIFEAIYAIVVLLGMPVHYVADGSWLVFNHGGLIGNTSFAFLGPALYCTFYEIWIGFFVLHFVYRYAVVCQHHWKQNLEDRLTWKLVVVAINFGFLAFTCVCGIFFCTRQIISPELDEKVKKQFNIESNSSLGYILLRHKATDGTISLFGTTTIFNHYLLVGSSSILILYCSTEIWKAIIHMQKICRPDKEIKMQRQMFTSLVIQTAVPFVFCHIPSAIYLSFPFWDHDFSFGLTSLIFTWVTSVNKVVDPLIVIICIKEYRRSALEIIKGKTGQIGISTSQFECATTPVDTTQIGSNIDQGAARPN